MEKEPEQKGSGSEYSLTQFQAEMADFAAKEVSGEIASGHFLGAEIATREAESKFDASQLTEEDRDIWEKIKNGIITADEFHRYAFEVGVLDDHNPAKGSRVMFSEFAGNKAMRAIFENSVLQKKEEK